VQAAIAQCPDAITLLDELIERATAVNDDADIAQVAAGIYELVQRCTPLRQKFLIMEADTTLWYEQHKASKRNAIAQQYKDGITNELVCIKTDTNAENDQQNRQSKRDGQRAKRDKGGQTDNA
jgi:hypothetical protein